MRRILMLLIVGLQCLAMAAQQQTTIDGVIYKTRSADITYGCTVIGVADDIYSTVNILASVTFGGEEFNVMTISANGLNSPKIKEVCIQAAAEGSRRFTISQNSFNGCTGLEKLVLPSDLYSIHALSLSGNVNLSQIVLEKDVPPVNSLATLVDDTGIEEYKERINRVKLYVPDHAVDAYKADDYKSESASSDSWPVKGFWSEFDVRPISELTGEEPEPVEKPEGVRVPLVNGGSMLLLDAVPGHRIQLSVEGASILKSATFNGEDASAHIDGNVFVVPEYTGVAHFIPVFELSTSYISAASTDRLDIRIDERSVTVTLDGVPADVQIFNAAGQTVYNGVCCGVGLVSGIYVLKAENRTFKFAL